MRSEAKHRRRNPVRKVLFSRLPVGLTHHLSLYPAALLWLALRAGIRPIEYFRLLSRFDFGHLRSVVFDQMLPRIAHYWSRKDVLSLMQGAGLEDIRLAWVNQMSWSAVGTRPLAHDPERLQTFRTRSCAKSKSTVSVPGSTLSKNTLNEGCAEG
jgi:hypothetical protein